MKLNWKQWMTLAMIMAIAFVAAADTQTTAQVVSGYIDPTRIAAISFPSMRMRAMEGSLPIEDSMHAFCTVRNNDLPCGEWRNLTFVSEDRVTCHINRPTITIQSAIVHCTYVPSKDPRAIVLETIEQDSCTVELMLAAYTPPARERRPWLPEEADAGSADAVSPSYAMYRQNIDAFHSALEQSKRQIVPHSAMAYNKIAGTCGVRALLQERFTENPQQSAKGERAEEKALKYLNLFILAGFGFAIVHAMWAFAEGGWPWRLTCWFCRGVKAVSRAAIYVVIRVLMVAVVAILIIVAIKIISL